MPAEILITPATTSADIAAVAELFRAYQASLDVDLAYQDFAEELASLPGNYGPPHGLLLIARNSGGQAVGCVAMRPLSHGRCEMKRLFVAPAGRGSGVGRKLVEELIHRSKRLGHKAMVLDTLPAMGPAQGLYRALGFKEIAPYYDTPIVGTAFMALDLDSYQG